VNTTVERGRHAQPSADVEVERRDTAITDVEDVIEVGQEQAISASADDRSPIDADVAKALVDMASAKQATMSWIAPARAYYRGVEAAAEQVLHPEVASVRYVGWLDRHNPMFLSGYLETTALLAPLWSWPSDRTKATGRAA
jgi:hypothetical protein